MAEVDPLDAVSALYRAELEEEAELSLRLAAPHLDMTLLLPVLRGFIVARCVGEDISAGDALRQIDRPPCRLRLPNPPDLKAVHVRAGLSRTP